MIKKLEYFKIGKIVTTKGLKGELKIYSHSDEVDRFSELKYFYVDKDRETKYLVEKVAITAKNMIVIKIKSFDTIESVQQFIGKYIYIDRKNSYKLDEDEMFIADMIGMDVVTVKGEKIGTLVDVLQYSANDIYVVKNDDGKEHLIPATYEIVPEIDIENNKITVNPIPGLLEI